MSHSAGLVVYMDKLKLCQSQQFKKQYYIKDKTRIEPSVMTDMKWHLFFIQIGFAYLWEHKVEDAVSGWNGSYDKNLFNLKRARIQTPAAFWKDGFVNVEI